MTTINRYEPYVGYENKNILFLRNQIDALKDMIKILEDDLDKVQSNCDHHYQFSSSGMYEDNYVCKHCGHETER